MRQTSTQFMEEMLKDNTPRVQPESDLNERIAKAIDERMDKAMNEMLSKFQEQVSQVNAPEAELPAADLEQTPAEGSGADEAEGEV